MAETANISLPGAPNQPVPGLSGTGAIQGGLLRPGSIDQSQFQQLLMAQQQANEAAATQPGLTLDDYRRMAGSPRVAAPAQLPAQMPASANLQPGDGIPTLSAEQFAVLTGMSDPEPAGVIAGAPAGATAGSPLEMVPPDTSADMPAGAVPAQLAATSDPEAAAVEPPTDPDAGLVVDPEAVADGVPVLDPVEVTAQRSGEGDDPRVVWFDSMPDRDDRRMLEAAGKKWRVRETPGARELFLGPDGKFGWDDFVDIINPLQHIPVVAQIYRAVTGDQAYALAQFAGALPFGPISVASAVVDTMVRSQTGRDAGTDLAAAVLGVDNRTPEEADLHLVAPSSRDLAAAPGPVTMPQQAALPAASVPASAWTRESSGNPGAAG